MKKFSCVLLVIAMLLALASCGDDTSTVTENTDPPVIEEAVHTKEFRDESGKTVIKVSVTLPQITDNCDKKVKDYINSLALDIFNDACEFGESNIENAANFMKSMGSDKPWSKKITFETTHLSHRYACFIMKDSLSYFDSEVKPEWSTFCLDIKTGAECTLADFATIPDDSAGCFDTFVNDVIVPVMPKKFIAPEYINDEVLERFDEIVSPDNFYLTDDGLGIYFNKSFVHENLSGTYKISFTWEELSSVYELPEN